MPFHSSETRAAKEITPEIRARTFWGENMLTALVDLDANAILPTHSHPHEQISFILEGELEFELGDETKIVRAGDVVVIPSNVPHTVKVGGSPAKVLDTFSPVREDFKY